MILIKVDEGVGVCGWKHKMSVESDHRGSKVSCCSVSDRSTSRVECAVGFDAGVQSLRRWQKFRNQTVIPC